MKVVHIDIAPKEIKEYEKKYLLKMQESAILRRGRSNPDSNHNVS